MRRGNASGATNGTQSRGVDGGAPEIVHVCLAECHLQAFDAVNRAGVAVHFDVAWWLPDEQANSRSTAGVC